MLSQVALAFPLFFLGQVAVGCDLGARLFAIYSHHVNRVWLIFLFGLCPLVIFWAPWLLCAAPLVGLSPWPQFQPVAWMWTFGGLGAAYVLVFLFYPPFKWRKLPPGIEPVALDSAPHPEPGGPAIELRRDRVIVPDSRLAAPLTIGVISDLHLQSEDGLPLVRHCLDRVNAFRADFVVILGDLTREPLRLPLLAETLAALRAPLGVFAVLGNHDLMIGGHAAEDALRGGPVRLLRPASGEVIAAPGVTLASSEWPFEPDPPGGLPRRKSGDTSFRILLAHSPDNFPRAVRAGFDLVLCGHTHGGFPNLGPIGSLLVPIRQGRKLAEGWREKKGTRLFVTRGIGHVAASPFAPRPQVACVDLTPAAE
ncbi:MAG TPA: metallophosphoesterase [Candidatus Brocadiia bacterium]|nr:metallophosphoesterase [Candidatus Brocadiia bacterium]